MPLNIPKSGAVNVVLINFMQLLQHVIDVGRKTWDQAQRNANKMQQTHGKEQYPDIIKHPV